MNSLRAQLTMRLLAGGVVLLVAAGALLHWQMRRALTAEFDRSLVATFRGIASLVEQKFGHVSIDFTGEDVSQIQDPHGSVVFLLNAADGSEIARSQSLGEAKLQGRSGSLEAPAFFDRKLADGRVVRCTAVRMTPPYEDETPRPPQVDAVVYVGLDRAPLDRTLAAIRTSLWLVGASALAALGALVYLGVRSGLAPLDRLGADVAVVDAGSLATRFPLAPLPAELQPIVVRLNELLARLESAFARERRFTATAAHELRTPLAELRALAEVNLSTPGSEDENEQSWRDALETTLRMEALALTLLDLTRAEDGALALQRTTVSLAQAVAAAWQPWAGRAAERQIVPRISIASDLKVEVDPVLLAVILGNLCGNAVEHSPQGSAVTACGKPASNGVSLQFENETDELTAADIPHLFERFWRKDGARSDGRHHGLGLAMAAEFATLLGGTLGAELCRDGFVIFNLWIPGAGKEGRS